MQTPTIIECSFFLKDREEVKSMKNKKQCKNGRMAKIFKWLLVASVSLIFLPLIVWPILWRNSYIQASVLGRVSLWVFLFGVLATPIFVGFYTYFKSGEVKNERNRKTNIYKWLTIASGGLILFAVALFIIVGSIIEGNFLPNIVLDIFTITYFVGAIGAIVFARLYVCSKRVKNKAKISREQKPMEGTKFGDFGGQFVPETLMNALKELESAWKHYSNDEGFKTELANLLNNYANRPSPLYFAENLTKKLGGAKIYLKREDLNHTGSHKINNVLGQTLLAKKMGKKRVIAETGAGQHGVATATAAAYLGMECEIFMGEEDTIRQELNVFRMEMMGAKVHPVTSGTKTLKDAVNQTMREWVGTIEDTYYVLGSAVGPHPFPMIVRDLQKIIGEEIKDQLQEQIGKLPDVVMACVGGGSNAIGAFYDFVEDKSVKLIGCEAAGRGVDSDCTAATVNVGSVGIFHGMKSYFCQDDYGQIAPVYSISAGLDYPGVGPEHAWLHESGRAEYIAITDNEAVEAFYELSRVEGIIPAIESAHAVAGAIKTAPKMKDDEVLVVCLSGRGDKDVAAIAARE